MFIFFTLFFIPGLFLVFNLLSVLSVCQVLAFWLFGSVVFYDISLVFFFSLVFVFPVCVCVIVMRLIRAGEVK